MADAGRYLVTFEDVTATVGGFDISSILELQLSANANGVPSIVLMVDAGHTGSANTSLIGGRVTVGEIRKAYDALRPMVKTSGATLSLSLTARAAGGADIQTLKISGWMLTDVAASPVEYKGVCTLSLTFMHPLCKAHFGGMVPGLLSAPPDLKGLHGANPLDAFAEALRVYGAQAKRERSDVDHVAGMRGLGGVRGNMLQRLSQASAALTGALAWKGPSRLPAQNVAAVWTDFIRMGLLYYALPGEGLSVLGRFMSMAGECSLAIGGDFTSGQLEVGPFLPWAPASLSLDDSDITDMQFPSQDPTPLSGVRVESTDASVDEPTSHTIEGSQLSTVRMDSFYIPQSELDAEFLYGPIQQFSEPGWLMYAHGYALDATVPGKSDVRSASMNRYSDPRTVSRNQGAPAVASAVNAMKINYGSALLACAKAYFETSVMKDWAFTIGARFIVSGGGGLICPGRVLSVRSNGAEVLAGYVASVRHTISVAGRTAKTEIACTHPRFGAPPFGISGTSNALYS